MIGRRSTNGADSANGDTYRLITCCTVVVVAAAAAAAVDVRRVPTAGDTRFEELSTARRSSGIKNRQFLGSISSAADLCRNGNNHITFFELYAPCNVRTITLASKSKLHGAYGGVGEHGGMSNQPHLRTTRTIESEAY